MSKLCGKCLHAKEAHNEHNGHFMYCCCCLKLCDLDEFNTEYEPSSLDIVMRIAGARQK